MDHTLMIEAIRLPDQYLQGPAMMMERIRRPRQLQPQLTSKKYLIRPQTDAFECERWRMVKEEQEKPWKSSIRRQ